MKQLTMDEVSDIIVGLHEGEGEAVPIKFGGGVLIPVEGEGFQFVIWLKNIMGDDFVLTILDIVDVPPQCEEQEEINAAIQWVSERFFVGGALQDHLTMPLQGPTFWMRTRLYTEESVRSDIYLMQVIAQEARDEIVSIRLGAGLDQLAQLDET